MWYSAVCFAALYWLLYSISWFPLAANEITGEGISSANKAVSWEDFPCWFWSIALRSTKRESCQLICELLFYFFYYFYSACSEFTWCILVWVIAQTRSFMEIFVCPTMFLVCLWILTASPARRFLWKLWNLFNTVAAMNDIRWNLTLRKHKKRPLTCL